MPRPNRSFVMGCLCGVLLGCLGLVLCALSIVYFFKDWVVDSNAKRLRTPPITLGVKADYDWQVIGLDGAPLPMKELEGKTVFLNFWHPDCVPCLAEISAINALYDDVAPEGVAFLGIALGDEDEVRAAVQHEGVRFPVYRLQGQRPAVYATTITPATFIIAPKGDIVFKHEGAAKWDDPATAAFLRLQNQK